MPALGRGVYSPLAVRSVLLLLASCAPLLLPAFLIPPSAPRQQTSTCFLGQAPTAAVGASPFAAASGTARRRCHANSDGRNGHTISAPTMVAGRRERHRCRHAYGAAPSFRTTRIGSSGSSSGRSSRSLLVLGARGGGRSGGDSSRRRTDRPDEYSSDRKKGKRKGGRGGRGGRSGGRSGGSSDSSTSGIGVSSGAPSPFEQPAEGELWGGESRLSTLDDRAPAEFSRKIDCSELSRKPK